MSAILSQIIRRQIATTAQKSTGHAATAGEHSGNGNKLSFLKNRGIFSPHLIVGFLPM